MSKTETTNFGAIESLEQAIDCWGDDVLRLATSTLSNRTDAEDVFQTVFLRLFSSGKRFTDAEHVKAWLLRVTINCCRDELKGARRQRVVSLEEASMAEGSASISAGDAVTEAAKADGDGETGGRLREALTALPARQRTALHLFYHDGYGTDEIAAIMEENPSTVRSHLYRARQSLKTKLGEYDA